MNNQRQYNNKRENGYYWIIVDVTDGWEVGRWKNDDVWPKWWITGSDEPVYETDVKQVNDKQIRNDKLE